MTLMTAKRLVVILAMVFVAAGCRSDDAAGAAATTNRNATTQAQIRCPKCQSIAEALPRLGGPVTPDGYKLHLAGTAVADGSCVGSRTVFVCRRCGTYSDDGIHAWHALPPQFGSQPHAADTNAVHLQK